MHGFELVSGRGSTHVKASWFGILTFGRLSRSATKFVSNDVVEIENIGGQSINVSGWQCVRCGHRHGAVNVVEQGRRKRPVAADRRLRAVVPQRSRTAHKLWIAAFALAKSSMTGRALRGKQLRAPCHRAAAGGQARTVVAAHVDIPSGDLGWRRSPAIAEMPALAGLGTMRQRKRGCAEPEPRGDFPKGIMRKNQARARWRFATSRVRRAGHRTRSRRA